MEGSFGNRVLPLPVAALRTAASNDGCCRPSTCFGNCAGSSAFDGLVSRQVMGRANRAWIRVALCDPDYSAPAFDLER